MVLVGVFPIDLQFDSMSNCFRRMNLWVNIPCFRRHLEDVFSVTIFLLPRRLEDDCKDVCKMSSKMSSRHLRKACSRYLQDVLQLSFEEVLKAPWRRLGIQENVTLKASRRLQDVFIAPSPRRMIAWEAVSSNRTVQLFF